MLDSSVAHDVAALRIKVFCEYLVKVYILYTFPQSSVFATHCVIDSDRALFNRCAMSKIMDSVLAMPSLVEYYFNKKPATWGKWWNVSTFY